MRPHSTLLRRLPAWFLALLVLAATPLLAQDEAAQDAAAPAEETPAAAEAAPAPPPAPPTSDDEAFRQFDFWVGEWEVHFWGRVGEKQPAVNTITRIQDGCALREEYVSPAGSAGTSLNFYDRLDGRWHQTWIGNNGQALYLEGGLEDGKMVLSDDPQDERPKSRITWEPLEDGSVRQTWELTRDGGETWTTVFDGHYIRKEG